jgi:hypothetical protein
VGGLDHRRQAAVQPGDRPATPQRPRGPGARSPKSTDTGATWNNGAGSHEEPPESVVGREGSERDLRPSGHLPIPDAAGFWEPCGLRNCRTSASHRPRGGSAQPSHVVGTIRPPPENRGRGVSWCRSGRGSAGSHPISGSTQDPEDPCTSLRNTVSGAAPTRRPSRACSFLGRARRRFGRHVLHHRRHGRERSTGRRRLTWPSSKPSGRPRASKSRSPWRLAKAALKTFSPRFGRRRGGHLRIAGRLPEGFRSTSTRAFGGTFRQGARLAPRGPHHAGNPRSSLRPRERGFRTNLVS